MPSSLSLLVALAASASASIHFNAAVPVLAARQETPQPTPAKQPINPECKSVLMTFPTPPPEIKAEFMKNRPTDICAFSTPASISNQVASYSSVVSAWGTENKEKLGACSRFSKFLAFTACDQKSAAAPTQVKAAAAVGTQMAGMNGITGGAQAERGGVTGGMTGSMTGAVAGEANGARPEGARPEGARPEGGMTGMTGGLAGEANGARPEGARPEEGMTGMTGGMAGEANGARPEGARPEGGMTGMTGMTGGLAGEANGARPEGARPEGGRTEGGMNGMTGGMTGEANGARPEGGRAEGGRAEGGRAEGGRAEGGQGGSNISESDKDKNAKTTSMSTMTRAGDAAPQKTGLAMAAVVAAGFAIAL